MIFVLGSKKGTIEDVCSSIALSYLMNKQEIKAEPLIFNNLTKEVEYILKKYNLKVKLAESVAGKEVILVNHNYLSDSFKGIEKAKVLGVIDTHKISFESKDIITFITKPYKSTCTLVYELFEEEDIYPPQKIRQLLLCGIVYSTKNLTEYTQKDYRVAEILSNSLLLNLSMFVREFSKDLEKKENIFKKFFENLVEKEIKNKKIGVIVLKTIDDSLMNKKAEIIHEMMKLRKQGFHSVFTLIINQTQKKTHLLVLSENKSLIELALNKKIKNNTITYERMLDSEEILSSLKLVF